VPVLRRATARRKASVRKIEVKGSAFDVVQGRGEIGAAVAIDVADEPGLGRACEAKRGGERRRRCERRAQM
jgi:hypothetical protein